MGAVFLGYIEEALHEDSDNAAEPSRYLGLLNQHKGGRHGHDHAQQPQSGKAIRLRVNPNGDAV